MHNVGQWPNLRHLGEPLEGAEGLLEAVSFKKATESIGRGRVMNARWKLIVVAALKFSVDKLIVN